MKRISNKLMTYGVAIFILGLLLQLFSMNFLQFIFDKVEPQDVFTASALRMLSTISSTSVIPLGTTFIAASVVVRMLGNHLRPDEPRPTNETSGTQKTEETDVADAPSDDTTVESFTDDFYRR